MKLTFVRHGESEANVLHEISNRGLKHPLTIHGQQQATDLARALQGASFRHIFTSPILRAVQTAQTLTEALRIPYEITDALREYDCGILEGRTDAEAWQAFDALTESWLTRHDWEARIEQGESFNDIRARFLPFIADLVANNEATDNDILLVGHGGIYRCMLPLILKNVSHDFALAHPLRYTAAIIAEGTPSGLVCSSWSGINMLGNRRT